VSDGLAGSSTLEQVGSNRDQSVSPIVLV